jgi:mRNA interferase MazF
MKRGTIVLTQFPFTNLKTSKKRPAIVISKNTPGNSDIIVDFISTNIPEILSETDLFFNNKRRDFVKSGLKKTSVFKLDKIATLNKSIFTGELGEVEKETLTEMNKKLKISLDLE